MPRPESPEIAHTHKGGERTPKGSNLAADGFKIVGPPDLRNYECDRSPGTAAEESAKRKAFWRLPTIKYVAMIPISKTATGPSCSKTTPLLGSASDPYPALESRSWFHDQATAARLPSPAVHR